METSDKIILVLGTRGRQGEAVLRHLRRDGWKLRVLTPDADDELSRWMRASGIEVMRGDLNNKTQIDNAVAGVYGVFSVQSSSDGDSDEVGQAKRLAIAAKQARVQHLVHSSAAGCDRAAAPPHLHAKLVVENYLKERQIPTTIFRPVYFMEYLWDKALNAGAKWAVLKDVLGDYTKLQMIACDDVGAFVALAFSNPQLYIGATLDIAGDELTWFQAAEAYRQVFGKKPPRMPLGSTLHKLRSRDLYRDLEWFREPRFSADISGLRAALPTLKTLQQFFEEKKR